MDFCDHLGCLVESHHSHQLAKLQLKLSVGNVEARTREPGDKELKLVSGRWKQRSCDTYHDECDDQNCTNNSGDNVDQVPVGLGVLFPFPLRLLDGGRCLLVDWWLLRREY